MSSCKFSDLIQQFDGKGDFSEWLKKLELVCKLQNVKALETVLPLFLSGGAFAVYDGLSDDVKRNYAALSRSLQQAFSANCFQAYEQFITRRLLPGESVDVYVSDLKRLAKLVDPFVSDDWLKSAMVHGLPPEVQHQLKAACCLQDIELPTVIERARSLVAGSGISHGIVAKANLEGSKSDLGDRRKCYICKVEGHLAWSCPLRKTNSSNVICHDCGKAGHYASKCSNKPKN